MVVLSPGGGHVERLLPLVAGLAKRSCKVHVLTRAEARERVEAAGAHYVDVFARHPLEAADAESIPLPCRYVSHAAAFAEPLAREVAALRPALIVYDSFFVAAPIVARRLGVPYVGMRAGHAQVPARAIAETRADPRVRISAACEAAVARLRDAYDLPGASPFSYLEGMSPHLNLCAEPPAFLGAEERAAFEPVAFFGSLAPELRDARSTQRPLAGGDDALRVYVSFGSVIWRYYADAALAALEQLAEAAAQLGARALIGLGNHAPGPVARARLARAGASVEPYVDQWGALRDADVFVTHHGLNSTHEAIYWRVPMLSYPFFGDQPAMARRCQQLGLALPLADAPRAPLEPARVRDALARIVRERDAFASRLDEARKWELEVIAGREALLDRVLGLARAGA